jgi:hypothetical protein
MKYGTKHTQLEIVKITLTRLEKYIDLAFIAENDSFANMDSLVCITHLSDNHYTVCLYALHGLGIYLFTIST